MYIYILYFVLVRDPFDDSTWQEKSYSVAATGISWDHRKSNEKASFVAQESRGADKNHHTHIYI